MKTIDVRKISARMKSLMAKSDEWHNAQAGALARAHLAHALREWRKGFKRRDLNVVGGWLEAAAKIENLEVHANGRAQLDQFYGPSPGFYSGLVEAQKRKPQSAEILALMQDVATLHAIQDKLLGEAKPKGTG